MGAQTVFLRGILPSILFVSLAGFAHHVILGGTERSGSGVALVENCVPGVKTVTDAVKTGVPGIDVPLCSMVVSFQASFAPEGEPLLWGFGTSLATFVALPMVEFSRAGRSLILAWPFVLVMGIMYQLQGIGVLFNLYWLAMILTGHINMRPGPRVAVNRVTAEANTVGVLAGFALPSWLMLNRKDPLTTAAWQLFPAWVILIRAVYILFRSAFARKGGNGYAAVQTTYLVTFALSVVGNVYAARLLGDNLSSYLASLPPPIDPPPFTGSVTVAILQLLTWDWITTAIGGFFGTLWVAQSPAEVALIAVWNVFAIPLLGTGAAVSGVLMWREKRMNRSKAH